MPASCERRSRQALADITTTAEEAKVVYGETIYHSTH